MMASTVKNGYDRLRNGNRRRLHAGDEALCLKFERVFFKLANLSHFCIRVFEKLFVLP